MTRPALQKVWAALTIGDLRGLPHQAVGVDLQADVAVDQAVDELGIVAQVGEALGVGEDHPITTRGDLAEQGGEHRSTEGRASR